MDQAGPRGAVVTRAREPIRTDGAFITPDGRYRYFLRRQLGDDPGAQAMVFVMLNPSTADATTDDPTIRRCRSFAEREGYGALEVVNLYAWRAADPLELRKVAEPVGPDNDRHILAACTRAGVVVAAWGALYWTDQVGRIRQVVRLLKDRDVQLQCLDYTSAHWPRHPLFMRADASLKPWELL